jgi:hypothetical protein
MEAFPITCAKLDAMHSPFTPPPLSKIYAHSQPCILIGYAPHAKAIAYGTLSHLKFTIPFMLLLLSILMPHPLPSSPGQYLALQMSSPHHLGKSLGLPQL